MKVNWIVGHFHPEIGGAETHAKEISLQLIERGHEVTVHTSSVTVKKEILPLREKLDGIQIIRYKPSFNWSFYFSKWKPRIEEGDVIALEGYPSLTNDYVRKKYGSKFPLVVYSLGVVIAVHGLSTVLKGFYDSFSGIKTLKKANKIIALTEQEKQWCQKKGIDIQKIEVIPAGIFNEAFNTYNGQIAKRKFGFDRYILFIGRMFYEKSPTHLVQAFSKLSNDFKNLGMVFVGPDLGEASKVKSLAEELGLEDRVVYAGMVSNQEKYELLAGCEFFVLPSKIEAQGIVFAEAWAQKKAVIGTRVGAVPYVVKDGITGLLYNYGDINGLTGHIKYLLENPNEAKTMGERGFEITSRQYRWNKVIDRIETVYKEAAGEFAKK